MPGSMFESPTRGTSSAPGSMFESGPVREQPEPKWAKTLTLRDAQLMLDVDPGGQLSTMQKRAISRVLNKDLSTRGVMGQRFTDDLSLDSGDGNVVPYPQWKTGAMQNQQRQQAEQRSERQREADYRPGIVMQGVGEAVAPGMSLLGMATDPLFGTKFKEAAWSLQNPTLPEDMGAVESGARHVSSLAGTLMGYAMGGEMLPASPIVQRLGMFGMGTAQGLTAGESAPVALTQGVLGAAMPHFKGNFAERAIQNAGYGGVFGVGTEAARELEAGKIDLAALGKAFGSGVGAGTLMHGMTELPGFVGRPTRDVPQTQSPTGVTPAAGVSQGGVQGPPRPTMEQVAREIQDRLVRHATGNVDSVQAAMDRAQARPYTPDMGNPNEVVPGNKPFLSEDRPATSRPFFRQPMSPQEAAVSGVQRSMDIAQLRPYTPSLENPNTIPSSPEWGPVPTNRQFFENRGEVIPNGKEVRREEEGQVAPSEPEAVAPQTPPEPKAGGVVEPQAPEVSQPEPSGTEVSQPAKQPWEMTRDEFVAWHNEQANAYAEADKRASIAERVFGADHPRAKELRDAADKLRPESDIATVNRKWWVSRAVQTGKTVPPEVLADYPDLAPQEAKPAEPESRDPGVLGEQIDDVRMRLATRKGRYTPERPTEGVEPEVPPIDPFAAAEARVAEPAPEPKNRPATPNVAEPTPAKEQPAPESRNTGAFKPAIRRPVPYDTREAPESQDPNRLVSKSGRPVSAPPYKAKGVRPMHTWVIKEAISEAEARGDEYNASMFKHELPVGKNGAPPATIDSANEYVFGRTQTWFEINKPNVAAATRGVAKPTAPDVDAKARAIKSPPTEIPAKKEPPREPEPAPKPKEAPRPVEPVTDKPVEPAATTDDIGDDILPGIEHLDPTDRATAELILKESAARTRLEAEWDNLPAKKQRWQKKPLPLNQRSIDAINKAFTSLVSEVKHDGPENVRLFALPGQDKAMLAALKKAEKVTPEKIPMPTTADGVRIPPLSFRAGNPNTPVKVVKTTEDRVKSVMSAASTENSRYATNGVMQDDRNLVSTDGRRVFILKGKHIEPGLYLEQDNPDIWKGSATKVSTGEDVPKFPPYKDVIPKDAKVVAENVDTAEAARGARRAAIMTNEESRAVLVVKNPDGSLGFAARAPEGGTVEINVRDGYEELGAMNPLHFAEAMDFARANGSPKVRMRWDGPRKPLVIEGGDTTSVTMPINFSDHADPGEVLAQEIRGKEAPPFSDTKYWTERWNRRVKEGQFNPKLELPQMIGDEELARKYSRTSELDVRVRDEIKRQLDAKVFEQQRQDERELGVLYEKHKDLLRNSELTKLGDDAQSQKWTRDYLEKQRDDAIKDLKWFLTRRNYKSLEPFVNAEYAKRFPSPTSAPKGKAQRAEDWANDIISSTEARMEARSKARGTRLSANPLPDPRDLWDAGMWMAAHAVKAGVRGGVALTKFVSDNMGKITAFEAKEHLGEIRKYAARIIKSGLGEGGAFDQAKATDYYQRATARLEAETPTGKARRLGWEQRGEVFKTQLRDFVEAAREAQRRTRMMAGIEQRGAVEAEKFKAGEKAKSVAELQDMAAELADLTPREIRGKYVKAVVDATTPLKLSRLAVRMGKDYDAYVARHAALYIQSRTSDKMMRGLTRDRADQIRKIVAGLPEDYRMILKTPRGQDKPSEYGVRLAAQNIIEARNEIARIRNEQRLEKQATLKNQVVKIAHERNQLMGAIKERPELSRPDGVDARLGLAKNLLWMKALHPERLFKWIEGSRGKTFGPWRKSFVRMDVATNRADKRVFSLTDRANDIVKRYGYKSLAHFMQETSGSLGSANTEYIDVALTNRDGKVLRQRLTRGEALSLYAMDPETRKQVLNGRPISFDSEADTFSARVTPGYLRDVFSQLSAGDKAIVDRWKEMHGKEFFDDLDRVKFNMTGSRLSPVESYFPRRVNREMMDGFEASLPKWARDMAISLHELPFMQKRTGGMTPLLVGDFGTIMLRQAHASAAVAEKAELLHLLQSTVQSPYIKTALTNRFGVQTTERVYDIIREWAGSRIGKESKFGPQVRWLMQNFGQAQTQANPRSWMRQLGTFFTMAHEVGWTDYAKHMGLVADYSEFKDLVQRRPELRKRYEHSWVGTILGSDAGAQESGMKIGETAQMTGRQLAKWAGEVPDALKTLQFHKFALEAKGANKAWNALKDHIKIANWFDGVALVPAYRAFQERARAENPTWTDKQVKDWASRAAAKTFLRAANTIDTLHSDAYAQAARTDPWYATVLQFTSDLSQRRNQVMEAIMDRDAGRVASASTAYAASALWSAAVTVAFGYGISHVFGLGGKQEDKDKEQAVKSGLLQVAQELAGIIPGGGRIVEAALSRPMAGRETTLTDTPLSQVFNGLARIIDETGRSMQEPGERAKLDRVDHMLRIGDQAFQLVSQVTGAPWTPFYGIARKAFKTAHPNVRETSGRVGDRGRSERR